MEVKNTKTLSDKPKFICVYGVSGIGKTSLASTLPGKTLVLDAENGLLPLLKAGIDYISIATGDKGEQVPEEMRHDRFEEFMKFISKPDVQAKYDNVVVDSLTEISQLTLKKMQKKYTGFDVWNHYASAMIGLLKFFRDLNKYNVVFTALEDFDGEEGAEKYQPEVGGKKVRSYIGPLFDFVIRYTTDKDGKRIFITSQTARTVAKSRSDNLAQIEEPHLGKLLEKINKEELVK
jgi:phage nucleotide-binding protein